MTMPLPALGIVLLTTDCWLKIPLAGATVTVAVATGTNLSHRSLVSTSPCEVSQRTKPLSRRVNIAMLLNVMDEDKKSVLALI